MNPDEPEIKVKCYGSLVFEDFTTRYKFMTLFTDLIAEISCSINDFTNIESQKILSKASEDTSYIVYSDDVTLTLEFHYVLPGNYIESILNTMSRCTNASISGSVLVETSMKKYNFKKICTDARIEVKCTGKLFFLSYKELWNNYVQLAHKVMNSFFSSYGLSPNIFISQGHFLVLRSHCFITEESILININEIKKALDSSTYGSVLLEYGSRETGFKQDQFVKQPSWGSKI